VCCFEEFDDFDGIVLLGGELMIIDKLSCSFGVCELLVVWLWDGLLVYGFCVGMILLVDWVVDG